MENAEDVLNDLVCMGIEPDSLNVYQTYLDRQTLEILYVPKPGYSSFAVGEHPDLLRDFANLRKRLAAEPERYVRVPEYSTEMAYEAMLGFANKQDVALRDEILYQLALKKPFSRFMDIVNNDETLLTKWRTYSFQDKVDFVKDWAKKNNITAFDN